MSDPLRIAMVGEGPTDRIVIQAAIEAIIPKRNFILQQIQPEMSAVFDEAGTGWVGVYRWCKKAIARRAANSGIDQLFDNFDLLVLHLDADVARNEYSAGAIVGEPSDLPCEVPCPPPGNTTNALRTVLRRWYGEDPLPGRVVICMPSKSTEAWVVAALFPDDPINANIECHADPASRLPVQPARSRVRKSRREYEAARPRMTAAWQRVSETLSEAQRFHLEFGAAASLIP